MSIHRSRADRVLVVDDDDSLAEMLSIVLETEGFDTAVCHAGSRVMAMVAEFNPDAILLDLMLPGTDGMTVCRNVRAESSVPIIMITAKSDTSDVVDGLAAGADDYLTKPFSNDELIARLHARLRRAERLTEPVKFGDIVLDPRAHTVTRAGRNIALTPLEFDLLACLLSDPSQVFGRAELLRLVWGYRHPGDTKLVNVHMTRLRSKIEDDPESPSVIRTVRGIGYQAIAP